MYATLCFCQQGPSSTPAVQEGGQDVCFCTALIEPDAAFQDSTQSPES